MGWQILRSEIGHTPTRFQHPMLLHHARCNPQRSYNYFASHMIAATFPLRNAKLEQMSLQPNQDATTDALTKSKKRRFIPNTNRYDAATKPTCQTTTLQLYGKMPSMISMLAFPNLRHRHPCYFSSGRTNLVFVTTCNGPPGPGG